MDFLDNLGLIQFVIHIQDSKRIGQSGFYFFGVFLFFQFTTPYTYLVSKSGYQGKVANFINKST